MFKELLNNGDMSEFKKHIYSYSRVYAVGFLMCIISYIILISNDLTNTYDGMWIGSYYREYDWVIVTGRYVWALLGFLRRHLCPEPITSILALATYAVAGIILIYIFKLKAKWQAYLIIPFFFINSAVLVALSYRHQSTVFAASVLFAVLAFLFLLRCKGFFGIILASFLIAGCLGCYQSNIGCFCVLVVVFIIYSFIDNQDNSEVINIIWRSIVSFVFGCIIYKIMWDIVLKLAHMTAAEYGGADKTSLKSIIQYIPQRIKDAYSVYWSFFWEKDIYHNTFQGTLFYRLSLMALFIILIFTVCMILKKDVLKLLLALILIGLIPLFTNIVLVLTPFGGGVAIQSTHPE